jgi:hypothetical protein
VTDDDSYAQRRLVERQRETAAGRGRHWDDPARPKVESSSVGLRRLERHRARLDVLCRRRVLARVLGTATPGAYEVAIEAVPVGTLEGAVGGWGVTLLALENVGVSGVAVACRCEVRMHHLDPVRLRAEAWQGRPGKPRVVGVSAVERRSG